MINSRSKTIIFIIVILAVFTAACAVLPARIAAATQGASAKAGASRSTAQAAVSPDTAQAAVSPDTAQAVVSPDTAQAAASLGATIPQGAVAKGEAAQGGVRGAASQDDEEELIPAKPLPPKAFKTNKPTLKQSGCRSTSKGIRMEWEELPGAEKYQIYRGETPDGEFEEFGETEETVFREKTDGSWYYKVRAVRGEEKSGWSLTAHINCVHGCIEKMYYDKNGFTHFRCSIDNRTDQPIWFYGQSHARSGDSDYQLLKVNTVTHDKQAYPYPLTAAIASKPNESIVVPAHTEGQTVDIYIPQKMPKLGADGMDDGIFRYRVQAKYYPEGEAPAFVMLLEHRDGTSRSLMRIAH